MDESQLVHQERLLQWKQQNELPQEVQSPSLFYCMKEQSRCFSATLQVQQGDNLSDIQKT